MRKIRDVLRLKLDAKLSHEQIAGALGISKGVVTKYVGLAAAAGLDWPTVQDADEITLERRLLVAPQKLRNHVQPDYGRLHQELRRKGSSLWGTIAHFPESFGDSVLPAALQLLAGQKVPSNHVLRHAVLTQKNVLQHYPAALTNQAH